MNGLELILVVVCLILVLNNQRLLNKMERTHKRIDNIIKEIVKKEAQK